MWPFTIFAEYTLNHWQMLFYRHSKRLIDYFTGTMSLNSLIIKLKIFWRYLQHNNDSKRMHSQKIIVYRLKKSIKSLCIMGRNVLHAFVWPFLVLTTSFTLRVNKINHWNDHWNIFGETRISNTLSAAKLIWNFPLRPERKISVRQKNFGPHFLSLNCVQTSLGVPFCYRKSLERIRGWEMWPFTIFAKYTLNHWKMPFHRHSKRLIDYFTGTMSLNSLILKLKIFLAVFAT